MESFQLSISNPLTPTSLLNAMDQMEEDDGPTVLPNGVYVPMPAFFTPDDELDIPAIQRHTARLLAAGVSGLVVHGSNGEAVHLSRAERRATIKAVADTVRHEKTDLHRPIPIIAGCSAQSIRETLELCIEAYEAGATHAIILPPGYYASLLTKPAVIDFFTTIASRSPIPILIYNFPAAANGLDLDSDTLLTLASHPRIVGVKLTCGNTGKLARLVAGTASSEFFIAGGSADFILQGLVVGAHGTICGFANLAPRACVRIFELWEQGRIKEARTLQHEVAKGDWLAIRYGFVGVKAAMPIFHGDAERGCAVPRLPFKPLMKDGPEVEEIRRGMEGVLRVERRLAEEARARGR
ncbi:uncharacterized protein CTHT_0055950 [Thermochaetoides thermophila DSM 1495]|uniref:Uncharacterized protein n=1 Tax=Chaetomium thermophilum (strain DSM 1495 / CBS 144.50 / IMI 039719) TaxID=759272 RepID=G0SC51_CHATD|nr:hypothetical protein CTHT_0055950 [Thermochaetoides thermophila DSM 1495]EGS18977.1 hypothetical protein CTHT_0055950 [Thermochaetoides thermophila DSM 1495]